MTNLSLSTRSLLTCVLFATACGAVVDPLDGDPADVVGDLQTAGIDGSSTPVVSPLVLEPPTRTSGPRSLADLHIADHDGIVNLAGGSAPFTVTEQRFVTQTDEVIQLELDLAQPSGTYGRALGSDVVRSDLPHVEHVLCEEALISTNDPRCDTLVPQSRAQPATGTLASGTWGIDLLDAAGASMRCTTVGLAMSCTLPAKKGAAYRIITTVRDVSDVWDGTAIGTSTDLGRTYAGNHRAMEYQCVGWSTGTNGRVYCENRYDYTRFVGLDRAWLAIDPLTVEVTANGFVDAIPSAPIAWDSGDDDLPGVNY